MLRGCTALRRIALRKCAIPGGEAGLAAVAQALLQSIEAARASDLANVLGGRPRAASAATLTALDLSENPLREAGVTVVAMVVAMVVYIANHCRVAAPWPTVVVTVVVAAPWPTVVGMVVAMVVYIADRCCVAAPWS